MGVRRIGAVLLDMDGLMLDTERLSTYCRTEARRRLGLPEGENLSALLMGRSHAEVRQIFLDRYGPDYPYEAVERESDRVWDEYMAVHGAPGVRPGLFYLLDYLKKKDIPRAVGSSTVRAEAVPLLEATGIAPYLDAMVFGDMVKRAKPEPDIFLAAAALLGVEPERCLVLEDSPHGSRSAHRAGMGPVMVPDLVEPDEEMARLAHTFAASLAEVPMLMEQMEGIQ